VKRAGRIFAASAGASTLLFLTIAVCTDCDVRIPFPWRGGAWELAFKDARLRLENQPQIRLQADRYAAAVAKLERKPSRPAHSVSGRQGWHRGSTFRTALGRGAQVVAATGAQAWTRSAGAKPPEDQRHQEHEQRRRPERDARLRKPTIGCCLPLVLKSPLVRVQRRAMKVPGAAVLEHRLVFLLKLRNEKVVLALQLYLRRLTAALQWTTFARPRRIHAAHVRHIPRKSVPHPHAPQPKSNGDLSKLQHGFAALNEIMVVSAREPVASRPENQTYNQEKSRTTQKRKAEDAKQPFHSRKGSHHHEALAMNASGLHRTLPSV
jgi:hypothetical protein